VNLSHKYILAGTPEICFEVEVFYVTFVTIWRGDLSWNSIHILLMIEDGTHATIKPRW